MHTCIPEHMACLLACMHAWHRCIHPSIWMNYNDVTVTSLKCWFWSGELSPNGLLRAAVLSLLNYYASARYHETIVFDKIRLQYIAWHDMNFTVRTYRYVIAICRFSKSSFSCYHRSFLCVDSLVLSARLFFDDCLWWLGRDIWMAVDPPKFPLGLSEDSRQNP